MISATERFKMLLANALERVCVLEAELEQVRQELLELRVTDPSTNDKHVEANG